MHESIISLYQKKFSGPDIARKLGVNLRRVYRILNKRGIRMRSPSEQSRLKLEKLPLSFNFKKNLSSKNRELLVAGAMLYYGEGAKTGTTVDLANSDPKILKLFLKFLRNICGIDEKRLRFYLYCFSDQNQVELIDFWHKELQVNRDSFTKPYVRDSGHALLRRMPYGVLHIRYSDKRLLEKILELNSELVKNL